MEHIENRIFYHIQRKTPLVEHFWENGFSTFVGDTKNPFSQTFDVYGFQEIEQHNIVAALVHYQKFARETIFEEVRRDYFSNLPSRSKCLWVIPEDDVEAIEYWKNELIGDGECRILRLSLTGIFHKANQNFLELNNFSMNFNRQQAFKYWSGASGNGSREDEYLFQGFVEVLESTEI